MHWLQTRASPWLLHFRAVIRIGRTWWMPVKYPIPGMPLSSRGLAGYGRHESLVIMAVMRYGQQAH